MLVLRVPGGGSSGRLRPGNRSRLTEHRQAGCRLRASAWSRSRTGSLSRLPVKSLQRRSVRRSEHSRLWARLRASSHRRSRRPSRTQFVRVGGELASAFHPSANPRPPRPTRMPSEDRDRIAPPHAETIRQETAEVHNPRPIRRHRTVRKVQPSEAVPAQHDYRAHPHRTTPHRQEALTHSHRSAVRGRPATMDNCAERRTPSKLPCVPCSRKRLVPLESVLGLSG
jgi:hypothetical protein